MANGVPCSSSDDDDSSADSMSLFGAAIKAAQELGDMDDNILLEALDFLEKKKNAVMFMAITKPKLRRKWLLRKLRPQPLKIAVTHMDGSKMFYLDVLMSTTVEELRATIQERLVDSTDYIYLSYGDKCLACHYRTLVEYGISNHSIIEYDHE